MPLSPNRLHENPPRLMVSGLALARRPHDGTFEGVDHKRPQGLPSLWPARGPSRGVRDRGWHIELSSLGSSAWSGETMTKGEQARLMAWRLNDSLALRRVAAGRRGSLCKRQALRREVDWRAGSRTRHLPSACGAHARSPSRELRSDSKLVQHRTT